MVLVSISMLANPILASFMDVAKRLFIAVPLKSRQDNSCIGADLTSDYSRSSGESEPDSFHSLSDTESEYEDKGSFRRSSLRMNSPDEESDRDPRGVNQIWRKMGAPSKRSPESGELPQIHKMALGSLAEQRRLCQG